MQFTIEQLMQYATEKGLTFEAYSEWNTESGLIKSHFGYTYGAGCWYWYDTFYINQDEKHNSSDNNTYNFRQRYSQNTGRISKGWKTNYKESCKIDNQLKISEPAKEFVVTEEHDAEIEEIKAWTKEKADIVKDDLEMVNDSIGSDHDEYASNNTTIQLIKITHNIK